jgi:hypothetical protein
MAFEYIIGLDISSVDTGITILNVETKQYKTFSIKRKALNKIQKLSLEANPNKSYQLMYDCFNIQENIGGALGMALKEYRDFFVEQKKTMAPPTPLIVHIVPEKPFIPFSKETEIFKKGSNVTSIYYGIFVCQVIQYIQIISENNFVPIFHPVMPNSWKAHFKVRDKEQSIAIAKRLGLQDESNHNIADSYLIAMWYLETKLGYARNTYKEIYKKFNEWAKQQEEIQERKREKAIKKANKEREVI